MVICCYVFISFTWFPLQQINIFLKDHFGSDWNFPSKPTIDVLVLVDPAWLQSRLLCHGGGDGGAPGCDWVECKEIVPSDIRDTRDPNGSEPKATKDQTIQIFKRAIHDIFLEYFEKTQNLSTSNKFIPNDYFCIQTVHTPFFIQNIFNPLGTADLKFYQSEGLSTF